MKTVIATSKGSWTVDLTNACSLARPVRFSGENDNAFWLPRPEQIAFSGGGFVGDTTLGGACNCRRLSLHPHGDGTHTESAQHIDAAAPSVVFVAPLAPVRATLLSVAPRRRPPADLVVEADDILAELDRWPGAFAEAVVLRTRSTDGPVQWSGTNPPWLAADALASLAARGVLHIVLDLPSVDREDDGGALAAHHRWWAGDRAHHATITELAHIPAHLADGPGLLFLGIAPIDTDAVPSRPIWFPATPDC